MEAKLEIITYLPALVSQVMKLLGVVLHIVKLNCWSRPKSSVNIGDELPFFGVNHLRGLPHALVGIDNVIAYKISAFRYRLSAVGRLAGLGGAGWYKDTLGRVRPLSGEAVEKNSGGWLAVRQGEDQVLGLLARRTQGIVAPRSVSDETDGLQVVGSWLGRSAMDWNGENLANFIDLEIRAGNIFRLETLIVLKEGTDWRGIDRLRRQYADPPIIAIESCTLSEET